MISHELRSIFIHVQKSGGHSIQKSLGMAGTDRHRFAIELKERYDPLHWDAYFKFAFVRNPWDRLVSWYSAIDAARSNSNLNKFFHYVQANATTFRDFVFNCTDEICDDDGNKCIYTNQIAYLTDANETPLVDFIGRFERLQEDFDRVCTVLEIDRRPLPRITHGSVHKHYSIYYTDEMREFVGEKYKRDIDFFGYMFEPETRTTG